MNKKTGSLFLILMEGIIPLLSISPVVMAYRVRPNLHLLAEMDIETIDEYIGQFQLNRHRYPQTYEEVCQALYEKSLCLQVGEIQREGIYLLIPLSKDPWGQAYRYVSPGLHNKNSFDIFSVGQDKQYGTSDDINNWDNNFSWRESYQPGRLERIFWFLDELSPLFWAAFLLGFVLSLLIEKLTNWRKRKQNQK